VHAARPVHQLRDFEIDRHAGQSVSVLAAQLHFFHQEIDSFERADARRLREIRIQPHRDVMRGRFRARPIEMTVVVQNELEHTGQRSLHRRDIHFAAALAGVTIADFEQRSRRAPE